MTFDYALAIEAAFFDLLIVVAAIATAIVLIVGLAQFLDARR